MTVADGDRLFNVDNTSIVIQQDYITNCDCCIDARFNRKLLHFV